MNGKLASLLLCLLVVAGVHFSQSGRVELVALRYDGRNNNFSYTEGLIQMSIERIAIHRFFTIYSYVYGDRSHMEVEIMFEHLEKRALPKTVVEIFLTDDYGKKIYPVPNLTLQDFPPDHALGYKLSLLARFPAPPREVQTVDITVRYDDKTFKIDYVPIR